eukprot:388506-Pyramimonas_sp.AAC.1
MSMLVCARQRQEASIQLFQHRLVITQLLEICRGQELDRSGAVKLIQNYAITIFNHSVANTDMNTKTARHRSQHPPR